VTTYSLITFFSVKILVKPKKAKRTEEKLAEIKEYTAESHSVQYFAKKFILKMSINGYNQTT
jgi:hypothetical protein